MNHYPTFPLHRVLSRVQESVEINPEDTYKQVTVRLFHKGVILRGEQPGAAIRTTRQWRVKAGQVLLSRIDARNGAIGLVPPQLDGAIVTNDFWAFQVHLAEADPRFLDLYFGTRQFVEACQRASEGTTNRVRLQPKRFLEIHVPLPPLPEQRRIVARIEELSAKVEKARALRDSATQETTAAAPAAGRKVIGQVKVAVTPLRTWLQEGDDGIQTGPFGAQLSSTDFTLSGVPVLTIGNVQYGGLKLDTLRFVSENKAGQLARYGIKEGDILFARMGTVGRCCIVPKEAEGWLINYHIIRVRLDRTRIEPRYVHWGIQASAEIEEYLDETIRGATREGVNSMIVGGLPCRVPSLPEQRRIVEYLDNLQAKVDALKKLQEETAKELNALLPSILSKAFAGEL